MDAPESSARIESLLAHSDWLVALARRLVRDPATADDLVQDTWYAALRSPRTAIEDPRGWLATLLANRARSRARAEAARRMRERGAAAVEAVEPADVLVQRAEAQRRLLGALLALDEPYRGTLLACYAQGRTPAAIAQEQGTNASTVRTRLERGLALLRERLQRDGRSDWMLALAPLGSMPIDLAVRGASANGSATPGASLASGAWIMTVGTKVACAVAAVVVCAWILTGEQTRSTRGSDSASAVHAPGTAREGPSTDARLAGADVEREREVVGVAKSGSPPAVELANASTPASTRETVTLELVVERDGASAPGVGVWVAPSADWQMLDCLDVDARPPASARFAQTDASGLATFDGLVKWRCTVGLDTASPPVRPTRFETSGLHAGYRHVISLGTAAVRGTVYDADGRPRADVGVQVGHAQPNREHMVIAAHARTDANGEYRIEDLAAGAHTVVMEPDGRFDGRGTRERTRVEIAAGAEHVVDFGSPRGAPRWSGRVLNAFDEPFPGTGLLLLKQERAGTELSVPIDADGRFEVCFRPGVYELVAHVAGSSDAGFRLGTRALPQHDLECDVIVEGVRLTGRVLGPDGKVHGALLQVAARPKGHDYPSAFREVDTSGDGRFTIDGLEPGTWLVSIWPGRVVEGDWVEIVIAPGARVVQLDLSWTSKR